MSAAASVDHVAGGNLGAELAQAKRREAEATTRVAALEAKLKSSSSVHGEMQASVQELSHRLQVCTVKVTFAVQAHAKQAEHSRCSINCCSHLTELFHVIGIIMDCFMTAWKTFRHKTAALQAQSSIYLGLYCLEGLHVVALQLLRESGAP